MIRDQVIWAKDDFFPLLGVDYRVEMDPSAVELPEKKIALYQNFHYMDPKGFIGWIHNIRLVEGEIVGNLQFRKEGSEAQYVDLRDEELIRLGGYYDYVQQSDIVDGVRTVTSCRLRAVSYVMLVTGANPGAHI